MLIWRRRSTRQPRLHDRADGIDDQGESIDDDRTDPLDWFGSFGLVRSVHCRQVKPTDEVQKEPNKKTKRKPTAVPIEANEKTNGNPRRDPMSKGIDDRVTELGIAELAIQSIPVIQSIRLPPSSMLV